MAGRFSKQELKNKLQQSAFHIVMSDGIEGVTTRKLSRGCGLSEPYIYQCYNDIPDLMRDTFVKIDGEISAMIQELIEESPVRINSFQDMGKMCWLLWSFYWKFLMDYPERTVFYWRYYQSGYYTKELQYEREQNYGVFVGFIRGEGMRLGFQNIRELECIVSMLIDDTVSLAVKILLGHLPEDCISVEDVYCSVFALLFRKLGLNIWDCGLSERRLATEEEASCEKNF